MLQEKFEDNIRRKLNDTELIPPANAWDNIDARLPKKKRRAVIWFALLTGLVVGAGVWFSGGLKNIYLPIKNVPDVADISNKISIDSFFNNILGTTPINTTSSGSISTSSHQKNVVTDLVFSSCNIIPTEKMEVLSTPHSKLFSLKQNAFNFFTEIPSPVLISSTEKPKKETLPKKNSKPKKTYSIGADVGLFSTYRMLKKNSGIDAVQQHNISQRNAIEYANLDFSGGVFMKRLFGTQWCLGFGFRTTSYSERVIFGTSGSILDKRMPAINMDETYKINNQLSADVFPNTNDSILKRTTDNSKTWGYMNYYKFSEVPMWVGYTAGSKKYIYTVEVGMSYMKLNVINTNILELDGVGFTRATETEHFKDIHNIMNASLAAGCGFKPYNGVCVSVLLQYKQAITPLIDYGFVRQYPYSIGIMARLEMNF